MTIAKAIQLEREGKLKEGEIIKWEGCYNSDTKQTEGGHLWVFEGGHIIGKSIQTAKNRKEAIALYKLSEGVK